VRETFAHPQLALRETGWQRQPSGLRNDQIDAAFLRTALADHKGLVCNLLLEEPMLVALPSQHPLAQGHRKDLLLKQLAAEALLYYRPLGAGLNEIMTLACRAAGFSPPIAQEAPRVTSALSLVAVGLGVSLVPASLRHVNMNGVVYRSLRGRVRPKAPHTLASRRSDPSPVVRHFVRLVRQAAKTARCDDAADVP